MKNAADISAALADVNRAMERAEAIAARAAAEHLQAFEMQMREKIGVDGITLNEPYLPFVLARGELDMLRRLNKLEKRLAQVKALQITIYGSYRNRDEQNDPNESVDFDDDGDDDGENEADDGDEDTGDNSEYLDELQEIIDREFNRSIISLKQDLDSKRQQSFGITHYAWSGGECEECAGRDGEIFEWGEGIEPGQVHENCGCSADPVPEEAGESAAPEITAADVAEMALLLVSLPPAGLALRLGISAVVRLGRIGQRILQAARRREQETPTTPQKPTETPNQTAKDILYPGGKPIGIRGKRNEVRMENGGEKSARALYKKLSKGGTSDTPLGYPGEGTRLPNGDWIWYRPSSSSGQPTIDININGVPFRKIHFLE